MVPNDRSKSSSKTPQRPSVDEPTPVPETNHESQTTQPDDQTIRYGKPIEDLARIETKTRVMVETQLGRLKEKRKAWQGGDQTQENAVGFYHRYPEGAVVQLELVVTDVNYAQGTLLFLNSNDTPVEILPGLSVNRITPVTDDEGDH